VIRAIRGQNLSFVSFVSFVSFCARHYLDESCLLATVLRNDRLKQINHGWHGFTRMNTRDIRMAAPCGRSPCYPFTIRENARSLRALCPVIAQTNRPRITRLPAPSLRQAGIDTDQGGVESVFIREICGQTIFGFSFGCGCAALG